MTPFLIDTFTDVDGTLLNAHTGETGATWQKVSTGDYVITDEGRLRANDGNLAYFAASGTAASPDSFVEAVIYVKSVDPGYCGVAFRYVFGVTIGFAAWYHAGVWSLVEAQSNTVLGTYTQTLTVGQRYTLRLECIGSALKVYVDNVLRISATSTANATGTQGAVVGRGPQTNSIGLHIESISGGPAPKLYKAITIDHTQCGASDSSNFPVAICLDGNVLPINPDFKSVANGGFVQNANGYDIRVYSDVALLTLMTFERVVWDPVTGKLEMHVLLTTLSHTVDTVFYLGYGDPTLGVDRSSNLTWPTVFKGVWHLKDGATLNVDDSSQSGYTGTNTNAVAAPGQMGGGAFFNGVNAEIALIASAVLPVPTQRTWSIWARRDGAGSSNFGRIWRMGGDSGNIQNSEPGPSYTFFFLGSVVTQGNWTIDRPSPSVWHHIVVTYDNSSSLNDPVIYVDGVSVPVTNIARFTDPADTSAVTVELGNRGDLARPWLGELDEARIADTIRSADWVTAEYNNQKAGSTFLSGLAVPVVSNVTPIFLYPGL